MYVDVSSGPPAERSGVDPFAELILVDVDGTGLPVDLLEIINDTRNANGISDSNRADLRWSLGIDGRVFLTNKKDGVIRELVHLLPGDFDYDNAGQMQWTVEHDWIEIISTQYSIGIDGMSLLRAAVRAYEQSHEDGWPSQAEVPMNGYIGFFEATGQPGQPCEAGQPMVKRRVEAGHLR